MCIYISLSTVAQDLLVRHLQKLTFDLTHSVDYYIFQKMYIAIAFHSFVEMLLTFSFNFVGISNRGIMNIKRFSLFSAFSSLRRIFAWTI